MGVMLVTFHFDIYCLCCISRIWIIILAKDLILHPYGSQVLQHCIQHHDCTNEFHFYFYSSSHNYNRKRVFSMWIKEGFHIEINGIEDGFLGLWFLVFFQMF